MFLAISSRATNRWLSTPLDRLQSVLDRKLCPASMLAAIVLFVMSPLCTAALPMTGIASIAAGGSHSCALMVDQTVRCWGANDSGQLGDYTYQIRAYPSTVAPLQGVTQLATGFDRTCALAQNGVPFCWGSNQSTTPLAVSGISGASAIAAGSGYTCVIAAGSQVLCWGDDTYDQLGDNFVHGSTSPVAPLIAVPISAGAIGLSAGETHTCALLSDHTVKCWGSNFSGELGNGAVDGSGDPSAVVGLSGVAQVSAGLSHTCAALLDGSVKCWGDNTYGELGNSKLTPTNPLPTTVIGLSDVRQVAAGGSFSCALHGNGTVACWGENDNGEIGTGRTSLVGNAIPYTVPGLTGVKAIAAGQAHVCAELIDGTASCWGFNLWSELGNGAESFNEVATPIAGAAVAASTSMSLGAAHACSVTSSGQIACWGQNTYGALGNGTTDSSTKPSLVPGLSAMRMVSAGGSHTCALNQQGSILCWGDNQYGQLGTNPPNNQTSPVLVAGIAGAKQVAAGGQHTCAVLNDRSVSCWGANFQGQLGTSELSYASSSTPLQVAGVSGAVAVAAGDMFTCALLADATVKCWGYNGDGELGNGSKITSATPSLVSGLSGVVQLSTGYYHACALLLGGSMACWGSNSAYEQGNREPASALPSIVASVSGISSIATGGFSTCALTSIGSASCWGNNYWGQLGISRTATSSSTPIALAGNYSALAIGYDFTCGLANGAISCWGDDSSGQLGSGSLGYFASPQTVLTSCPACKGFVPLSPLRLLDTRPGSTTIDGSFAGTGAVPGHGSLDLTVLGRGGVPAVDVSAVVLNVTATAPTAPGFLTVWPSGAPQPLASNLNFVPAQTIPNLVIAKVGDYGQISLFNSSGYTDVIADVVGYFTAGSDLTSLLPARLLDTRSYGQSIDQDFVGVGPIASGTSLDLTVAGRGGVLGAGQVSSVLLNITATEPTAPGYLTIWPTGSAQPFASNLNFMPNDTVPNLVMVKVGTNGKVSLFNSAGATGVIADAVGYFSSSTEMTPLVPARVLDTRAGQHTIDDLFAGAGTMRAGNVLTLSLLGRGGVPADGVAAVVLNLTATNPTAAGYITAWPTGGTMPLASNLNFVANQTIPNLVIAKLGANGQVSLFNSSGSTDVVADIVGWFPVNSAQ